MVEQLSEYMLNEGYQRVMTNVPGILFLFRQEMQSVNVILAIEYRRGVYVTADQYKLLKQQMHTIFSQQGAGELHVMTLIIAENPDVVRFVCGDEPFCWLIDPKEQRLVIYEHQVEDFYGVKGIVERFLESCSTQAEVPGAGVPYGRELDAGAPYGREPGAGVPYGREPGVGASYGREPRKSRREVLQALPWITIVLAAVNVLVYFICTWGTDVLYNKGDLAWRAVVERREYYRIYTSMFLHAGLSHLGSNMLVLYFLGEIIERRMGRIRYALLYFLAGTGAAAASVWYQYETGSLIGSVGASGAIYGVLGAMLWFVVAGRGSFQGVTLTRMLVFLVYSMYSGLTSTNIDNAAHVGGLICGFLLTALLTVKKKGADRA